VAVNLNSLTISHNQGAERFEMRVDGLLAVLTYRRFADRIVFLHAEVPSSLEGQGLAGKLTSFALDFARANHLRVVARCPYVSSFIRKHTEYQDLVSAEDFQKPSR
jgi:predicted GNAT family acetyltransferase